MGGESVLHWSCPAAGQEISTRPFFQLVTGPFWRGAAVRCGVNGLSQLNRVMWDRYHLDGEIKIDQEIIEVCH